MQPAEPSAPEAPNIERVPLSELLLDTSNPQFGGQAELSDQKSVLNWIVKQFSVDEVLHSISMNR
jgi:hypothetical protein